MVCINLYTVTEKEFISIVETLKELFIMLLVQCIKIYTDHWNKLMQKLTHSRTQLDKIWVQLNKQPNCFDRTLPFIQWYRNITSIPLKDIMLWILFVGLPDLNSSTLETYYSSLDSWLHWTSSDSSFWIWSAVFSVICQVPLLDGLLYQL